MSDAKVPNSKSLKRTAPDIKKIEKEAREAISDWVPDNVAEPCLRVIVMFQEQAALYSSIAQTLTDFLNIPECEEDADFALIVQGIEETFQRAREEAMQVEEGSSQQPSKPKPLTHLEGLAVKMSSKRTMSPYILYMKDMNRDKKKGVAGLPLTSRSKSISASWACVSDEQKAPWNLRACKLRAERLIYLSLKDQAVLQTCQLPTVAQVAEHLPTVLSELTSCEYNTDGSVGTELAQLAQECAASGVWPPEFEADLDQFYATCKLTRADLPDFSAPIEIPEEPDQKPNVIVPTKTVGKSGKSTTNSSRKREQSSNEDDPSSSSLPADAVGPAPKKADGKKKRKSSNEDDPSSSSLPADAVGPAPKKADGKKKRKSSNEDSASSSSSLPADAVEPAPKKADGKKKKKKTKSNKDGPSSSSSLPADAVEPAPTKADGKMKTKKTKSNKDGASSSSSLPTDVVEPAPKKAKKIHSQAATYPGWKGDISEQD